jgi:predicted nucleic acid-binding protein
VSALYIDASAFVKLINAEPQSTALRSFLSASGNRLVSSALLQTEAIRAVRHLGADALARATLDLRRIDLVPIDDPILGEAGLLDPSVLRTLDAIHLATALEVGPDLTAVVTYDRRMKDGARLLDLTVESPA